MIRRRALLAGLVLCAAAGLAAVMVLAAASGGGAPGARVERAVNAMESLRGVRFTFEARSRASGDAPAGGEIVTVVRGSGELVPPDRLRLLLDIGGVPHEIVVIGTRAWVDGRPSDRAAVGPLGRPLAALEAIRGGGVVRAAGVGWAAGGLTARYTIALGRMDLLDRLGPGAGVAPGSSGTIEIDLGLFDDRIRAQSFTASEAADGAGTGLDRIESAYRIEYTAWDRPLIIREPE